MQSESSERIVTRNFLALGSGEAVARIVAFGATVYLARRLGAEYFGVVGFATAMLMYLHRITDLGIDQGLGVREIAVAGADPSHLVSTLLSFRFLFALAVAALVAGAALAWMPFPESTVVAIYSLTLIPASVGTRWVHLGRENGRRVAIARTAGEIIMVLAVVVAVRDPSHLPRVPMAQLFGDAIAALVLLAWLRSDGVRIVFRLAWGTVRPLLPRALPLVVSGLLGLSIYNADLLFLRIFRDSATVGYYAAAYALISFLINLGTSYSLSLLPTLARLRQHPEQLEALYQTALAHVFAIALPAAAGGFLIAQDAIGLVFGPEYDSAVGVLEILVWSVPLLLIRGVPLVGLMANGREDLVLRATAWAASLNLLLNLALIPPFGLIGAATATAVTEGIRMVIAFAFARGQGYGLPNANRYWRALVATGTMTVVVVLVGPAPLAVTIATGVATYSLALWAVGGLQWRFGAGPRLTV